MGKRSDKSWWCGVNILRWIFAGALAAPMAVQAQPQVQSTKAIATVAGRYADPARKQAGVYGTDLGWTFKHEGRLWVLFGDSWRDDVEGQRDLGVKIGNVPIADDALGFVSLAANGGFPNGQAVEAFIASPAAAKTPAWRSTSPTLTFARLNNNPSNKAGPMQPVRDGLEMWSLPAQTPVAGFSNARSGAASGAFAIFFQNEKLLCGEGTCSNGYTCATNIGVCIEEGQNDPTPISQPCVLGSPSRPRFCSRCDPTPWFHGGMCVDTGSSVYDPQSNAGQAAAVVRIHQVGNARKDNPLKFDSQNWITQRFFNPAARTVSDFDATRANGAGNDYRTADGVNPEREGVFIWGRPNFGGVGADERDAQLYLAWVPMPDYNRNGRFAWRPQFFAGVGANGAPIFKSSELEAKPLDLDAVTPGDQPKETRDMVGQMTVAFIPSLSRWVMFYGGGMGSVFGELIFGADIDTINKETVGPIYVRYAEHPWGPWTAPEALLDPGDPDEPSEAYGPDGIMFSRACQGDACAKPQEAWKTDLGALYGPDIIDPWTTEQSDGTTNVYWHLSTWNPYQVLLMRTTFTAQ